MNRVKDKVAIVTGAGSGIGAACAQALAFEGAKVVFADINLKAAEQQAELARQHGDAAAIAVDVGSESEVQRMIDFTVQRFGGLDVLHNNAADTRLSSTRDAPVEQWTWRCGMRSCASTCAARCSAANTPSRICARAAAVRSSTRHPARLTPVCCHQSAYGASKAGIVALSKYVATQHGKEGIRCNAISPGFIVTPSTERSYATGGVGAMMLRHHLTPRVGRPRISLPPSCISPRTKSAFVTGQTLMVDGGMLAHQPFYADSSSESFAK